MNTETRYCRGCQQPFSGTEQNHFCPRCRQDPTVGVEQTVDMADTVSYDGPAAPTRSIDLARQYTGRTFDAYTIDTLVGRGGMAWVFRARHNWLHRPCAIKILCPELQQRSSDFLDKFIAEARAAASVVHPHIVTVHNIGQTGEHHYIELEYVAGRSLQNMLIENGMNAPTAEVQVVSSLEGTPGSSRTARSVGPPHSPSPNIPEYGNARRQTPRTSGK